MTIARIALHGPGTSRRKPKFEEEIVLDTVDPSFVINKTISMSGHDSGLYSVTHVKSGFSAISGLTLEQAKPIAAVFADLPLPWDTITPQTAGKIRFRELMPKELVDWFFEIRRVGHAQFDAAMARILDGLEDEDDD